HRNGVAGEDRDGARVAEPGEQLLADGRHAFSRPRAGAAPTSAGEVLRPPPVPALVDHAADPDPTEEGLQDVGAVAGAPHPRLHDVAGRVVVVGDVLADRAVDEPGAAEPVVPAAMREDALGRHRGGARGRVAREVLVVADAPEPGAPADLVDARDDRVEIVGGAGAMPGAERSGRRI